MLACPMVAHAESPSARRWPRAPVAALAVTLATAALGAWLHQRLAAQQPPAAEATFDAEHAMDLAGAAVPPEIESFYFFILTRGAPDESGELAQKLGQAADEHDFVGIIGADFGHNRRVLLAALEASRERSLAGLIIIYVGPGEQEAELSAVVRAAGAELRFVPYAAKLHSIQETI